MAILTVQDKQRIEAAIGAAEQRTAAEIVVTEVAQSDSYLDVRLLVSALFSLGASASLHLEFPLVGVGELFLLELALFGLGFWLFGRPLLLRRLLPSTRVRAAVARAAKLAFLEHALFATRDRTGVLILLSDLEHNVTILGDQGIHTLLGGGTAPFDARAAEAGWDAHVATIVTAIHAGKAGEGVCQVIEALTATLADTVPRRADDTNELADHVR